MIVGGYTLDLYCDNPHNTGEQALDIAEMVIRSENEFPHQYTGEYGSACRKKAREDGWLIHDSKVLCPKCSGKKKDG